MVKGLTERMSGYWMFVERKVRPRLEKEQGRRLNGEELAKAGSSLWMDLSKEEQKEWKEEAKRYNNSEAGCQERALRKVRRSDRFPKFSASRRFDEFDDFAKVYFTENDDFKGKRRFDIRELSSHLQFKYSADKNALVDYLFSKEHCMVTANVLCEYNKKFLPSEISLLKFSYEKGIISGKSYILHPMEPLSSIFGTKAAEDVVLNQTEIALLEKSEQYRRNDFAEVWKEIKAFTEIDELRAKLLVHADCWNEVVGSFQALFSRVNETTISRVECHFMTIEDYLLTLGEVIGSVGVDLDASVTRGMQKTWPISPECSLHTPSFKCNMKQAKSCSLLGAYEAVFNFFALSRVFIFPNFRYGEQHMPVDRSVVSLINDKCGLHGLENLSITDRYPEDSTFQGNSVYNFQREKISGEICNDSFSKSTLCSALAKLKKTNNQNGSYSKIKNSCERIRDTKVKEELSCFEPYGKADLKWLSYSRRSISLNRKCSQKLEPLNQSYARSLSSDDNGKFFLPRRHSSIENLLASQEDTTVKAGEEATLLSSSFIHERTRLFPSSSFHARPCSSSLVSSEDQSNLDQINQQENIFLNPTNRPRPNGLLPQTHMGMGSFDLRNFQIRYKKPHSAVSFLQMKDLESSLRRALETWRLSPHE